MEFDMRTEYIKSFCAVAETGSFTKASKTVFLTKQALFKQISALEEELQFPLIYRYSSGVELTPAGERFYEGSRQILDSLSGLIGECQHISENIQSVRIANPPLPFLEFEDLIKAFTAKNPDITTEIVTNQFGWNPVDGLLADRFDICCVAVAPGTKAKFDLTGIEHFHISRTPLYCLMSNSHPLAVKNYITPKDILPYRIGVRTINSKQDIVRDLVQLKPDINIVEAPEDETRFIYNFCFSGNLYLCRAFFACHLPPLKSIPFVPEYAIDNFLCYRSQVSAPVKRFVDFARKYSRNPELFSDKQTKER